MAGSKSIEQKRGKMASSSAARVSFRIVMAAIFILVLFYAGRPLYWKISATIQEIRENKQTVKQGITQIVYEAQKSVGWWQGESNSVGRRISATRWRPF